MPDRKPSGGRPPEDRSPAQREADHESLALLSDTLVPALMDKLAASGLGELEVREGTWRIRLRRPLSAAPAFGRRPDRGRSTAHADHDGRSSRDGNPAATGLAGGSPAEVRAAAGGGARADEPYVSEAPPRSVATSPTVGVFRPEVAVGTHVQAGDRVGVVDLLGIPQDVPSPIDGTLVEVYPAAGEAVEYGEAIAAVEADPPASERESDAGDPGATGQPAGSGASGASAPPAVSKTGAGALDGGRG
jgi:biotin carboxyl carrier protein